MYVVTRWIVLGRMSLGNRWRCFLRCRGCLRREIVGCGTRRRWWMWWHRNLLCAMAITSTVLFMFQIFCTIWAFFVCWNTWLITVTNYIPSSISKTGCRFKNEIQVLIDVHRRRWWIGLFLEWDWIMNNIHVSCNIIYVLFQTGRLESVIDMTFWNTLVCMMSIDGRYSPVDTNSILPIRPSFGCYW